MFEISDINSPVAPHIFIHLGNITNIHRWVIIYNHNFLSNIEHVLRVTSDYCRRLNDFLDGEAIFPSYLEFLQTIRNINVGNNVFVDSYLGIRDISDDIFQDFFLMNLKKNYGPVFVVFMTQEYKMIELSSEGSFERIMEEIQRPPRE